MTRTKPTEGVSPHTQASGLRQRLATQDLDATGHVRSAVLIDLAERAAVATLPEPGTTTDVKMVFHEPIGPMELSATASLRHQSGPMMTVEVELARTDGAIVCLIALAFKALGEAVVPTKEPAPAVLPPVAPVKVPLRERRADALIAAATQVIAKKGFASATMRDIAKAANTHVPTLYEYFPSKEALLEAIYRREMEAALEGIMRGVNPEDSTSVQLRQILSNQLHHAVGNNQSVALLNREFRHLSQPARVEMTALYRKLIAPYEDVLALGIARGELREVDTFIMANVFETVADMSSLRPFFFRGRQLDDLLQSLEDILVRGLLTKRD